MYILAKDNLLLGGTFYIEKVEPNNIVTTNDVSKALHFNSIEAAERFAVENNIRLVNFNSNSHDEVTTNYFYVSC